MKIKWKVILGAFVIAIGLGLAVFESTKAIEANVLEVQPRSVSRSFKEEGKVVPEFEQAVFPQYSGTIINLAVEEGQQVKKGELLAVLDSKELDYQTRVNELQIEQAQKDLENAETDFKRIEQLYNARAVSQKEYEDASNLVEEAKNNLKLQKAQIDIPQYQKDKYTIFSPLDGIVASLSVKKGEIADPLLPMMNIFKLDSYEVEVFILAADVSSIQKGMKVALIQDSKDEEIVFNGSVKKIAPAAEEKESALGLTEQRVKVTIEPKTEPATPKNLKLFPGYNLDVEFTLDQKDDVLVVPQAALFPYEEGDALWVVREGKSEVQPVTTEEEYNSEVVIVNGLSAGDLVILNPQLEGLKEGKKITVSQEN